MEYLIKLFYILTNGRPMIYNRTMYSELVKPINIYHDYFGRYWVSQTKWGLTRLRWMKPEWTKKFYKDWI